MVNPRFMRNIFDLPSVIDIWRAANLITSGQSAWTAHVGNHMNRAKGRFAKIVRIALDCPHCPYREGRVFQLPVKIEIGRRARDTTSRFDWRARHDY
jgi:hypothetical protein